MDLFQIISMFPFAILVGVPMLIGFFISLHFLRADGKKAAITVWSSGSFLLFALSVALLSFYFNPAPLQYVFAFLPFDFCAGLILLIWFGGSLSFCFLSNKQLPNKKEAFGFVLAAVIILAALVAGIVVSLRMQTATSDAYQKELQENGMVVVGTAKLPDSPAEYCNGYIFLANVKVLTNTEVFRCENIFYVEFPNNWTTSSGDRFIWTYGSW